MIRFAGLTCLLLSVLSGPALAASCVVPFIRTLDNQTVTGTMYVVSGKRCSIILQRSAGPIHGVKLVSAAQTTVSGQTVISFSISANVRVQETG